MKVLFSSLIVMMGGLVNASTPIEMLVPVDHVYAPIGFDSNDSVEIVVTGFLPNLCHKSPEANVTIEGNNVKVEVSSLYYQESNPYCPTMVVPFTKTIDLGLLDKGNYNIKVNGKSPWELTEKINVSESTSSAVDDFHYAYVNYIDKEVANGEVVLRGYNPSDCFVLDKIDYVHNGKDTYSVLPKMKQIRSFCPMKMVPFKYSWKVPNDLNKSKVLIHVRTMDGKSVNSVYVK